VSALQRLIIAGVAAALVSAPAVAVERLGRTAADSPLSAQNECTATRCETAKSPEFCIADDSCAQALPASAIVRFDALMDHAALH
jgi:hypothetical protein